VTDASEKSRPVLPSASLDCLDDEINAASASNMRAALPSIISTLLCTYALYADDWTSTDGKTYRDAKVIKFAPDAVTIAGRDGSILGPLSVLPPALQREISHDPETAGITEVQLSREDQVCRQAVFQQQQAEAALQLKIQESLAADQAKAVAAPVIALEPGSSAGAPVSDGPPCKWKLVWSDEFSGGDIDRSKWTFEVNGRGGGNGELEYYTDRLHNARVEDGKLIITADKEEYSGADGARRYTSARLITKGHADWKYGRIEARIKMPKGQGLWPAFWMMPADNVYGGWARSGEIDIVEVIGSTPNTAYGTLHYGDSWPHNVHTGGKFVLPSGDFSDDFHVFAIEWEKGVIRWLIDGKVYQTQTQWSTVAASFPAPFDQNFFIVLNVAVGGAWPGPPSDATQFPQTMEVDYVRVYQAQ
jgi:beta-glucanase (GH16 family)